MVVTVGRARCSVIFLLGTFVIVTQIISHLKILMMLDAKDGSPPIDIALALLLETELRNQPINAVIDRGDSPIQQFYCGSVVFVTGGSGFLGKQLIEKLLRACYLTKIYVLLRPKKGKSIQERLDYLLTDSLYDLLRQKRPDFKDKIVPIEGDVADMKLGLCDEDWTLISKEVDTVFHMAATIRFDESLRVATLTNVRGTRETLALARSCVKLKNFVYVSTAYSHATLGRENQPVLEQFYPCPILPETMIQLAETLEEKRLDDITVSLIQGWPNTYTFTKAIAEELVRTTAHDLPICVVRPPIVLPAFYEPSAGWMDLNVLQGPTGILTGGILGIVHVFLVSKYSKIPMTPVDFVNNATIAAAWDASRRRRNGEKDIPVYTVSHKDYSFMTWDFLVNLMFKERLILASPKAVWYCYILAVQNKFLYGFLSFFLHYIPAFIMDRVCGALGTMPNGINSFVGVYKKIDKFTEIYHHFLFKEWGFTDDNVQTMLAHMSVADRVIFNCNVRTLDFIEYIVVWGLGVRKFIIRDGLKDTLKAYKKQMKFKKINALLIMTYVVIIAIMLFLMWSFVSYLFVIISQ